MKTISITFALALAACGVDPLDDSSSAEDLCVRADECNALNGSVQECIENFNRCTGQLTSSQRADWERQVDDCLGYESCALAVDCYWNDVDWC
jgi:hypothetical protein